MAGADGSQGRASRVRRTVAAVAIGKPAHHGHRWPGQPGIFHAAGAELWGDHGNSAQTRNLRGSRSWCSWRTGRGTFKWWPRATRSESFFVLGAPFVIRFSMTAVHGGPLPAHRAHAGWPGNCRQTSPRRPLGPPAGHEAIACTSAEPSRGCPPSGPGWWRPSGDVAAGTRLMSARLPGCWRPADGPQVAFPAGPALPPELCGGQAAWLSKPRPVKGGLT